MLGVGVVAVAFGLALWPLNEPGVTGSAFAPHYRGFGWYAYTPLPANPTTDDLRRAGVSIPQDAVHRRQAEAAATLMIGIAGFGLTRRTNSRSTTRR